jgi:hypothetical protein
MFTVIQGYIRAEEHLLPLAKTLSKALIPVPRLRQCIPSEGEEGMDGTGIVSIMYRLTHRVEDVPLPDRLAENTMYFAFVDKYWREHGYSIVSREAAQPYRHVRARSNGDGFTVALHQGKIGNLWMRCSSAPVEYERITPPPPAIRVS